MRRREKIREHFLSQLKYYQVARLPPGHFIGDGHDHGGGARGVDHHDHEEGHSHEEKLAPGHYVGDGHNHGSGAEKTRGHSEEVHVHEGHEEEHVPQHFEQAQKNQSANQNANLESRFQKTASPSEQLRTMNSSAQSQASQSSKETQARQSFSAQSSFIPPHPGKMASLLLGTPNARNEIPKQSLQGQANNRVQPQILSQKEGLLQSKAPAGLQGEVHIEGQGMEKTANIFLQSLPQALRTSLGMVQSQTGLAGASLLNLSKNMAAFQALFSLSPKAFAEALEGLQSKAHPEQIQQQNRILGFQAYVPLTQMSLRFAFPNLLQRMEKAWNQFSGLLFGNYLLKIPPAEMSEEIIMQELGLLFMNVIYRKKEKKEVIKKVKKKDNSEKPEEIIEEASETVSINSF